MYGKMTDKKMGKGKTEKKGVPVAIMVAVGKPKGMPMRGSRTATNMMKKSSRGNEKDQSTSQDQQGHA